MFVVALSVSTRYLQNAFVQLSLAFRNDKYTLEMRLKQAERERNLTEEDTEKELEEFKGALKVSPPQRHGSRTSQTLNVPTEREHRCPFMSFGCVWLQVTSPQWQNLEQRESYQRLVETVSVLHRLARRLSSRAELVGAVRQVRPCRRQKKDKSSVAGLLIKMRCCKA